MPTLPDLTPERLATIRRLAAEGDPFWRGVAATLPQPPETPGAASCPTLAQRKDTT